MTISKTMTIKEAAASWDDPRAGFLERWGEMFDLRLEEVTQEHLAKYQIDRSRESAECIVNVEVRALTLLLKCVGINGLRQDGQCK
jgi:hypothetical protein